MPTCVESQIDALRNFGAFLHFALMRGRVVPGERSAFARWCSEQRFPVFSDPDIVGEIQERRKVLLKTGFPVPDGWLTCHVTQRDLTDSSAAQAKTRSVCDEIAAAILRLSAGRAKTKGVEQTAPEPGDAEPDAQAAAGHGGAPGRGMPWRRAMKAAEAHCQRNRFPGVNSLAKIVGCSPSTMSRACRESPKLRRMKTEQQTEQTSVSDLVLSTAAEETTEQTIELNPADAVAQAELDAKEKKINSDPLLRRLMEDATPQQRETYLVEKSIEKLREMAELAYDDPDAGQRVRGRSR